MQSAESYLAGGGYSTPPARTVNNHQFRNEPQDTQNASQSPVEALSAALEACWDTWRQAADAEAEAANAHERVYALAYRDAEHEGKVPRTALREHAQSRAVVVEANGLLNVARTNARTWARKWDTIHSQHMAALSSQRMAREMSGA